LPVKDTERTPIITEAPTAQQNIRETPADGIELLTGWSSDDDDDSFGKLAATTRPMNSIDVTENVAPLCASTGIAWIENTMDIIYLAKEDTASVPGEMNDKTAEPNTITSHVLEGS
jgi:hypothetical protein